MNRLIWGDNLLAMQALLTQGYAGKIDLIYIDPPFNSDADYSYDITIEGKQVEKEASIVERLAYTDTWEAGVDSYLDMIYPRLQLTKRLLSEQGSIYIHLDWRLIDLIRLVMDEIYGFAFYQSCIRWKRQTSSGYKGLKKYGRAHDSILWYSRSASFIFNPQYVPYTDSYIKSHYNRVDENGRRYREHWLGTTTQETIDKYIETGRVVKRPDGSYEKRLYLDEQPGTPVDDIWTDISPVNSQALEDTKYPTQKPEALLERIIKASSNEGDLVADFFCGSGTTMAVAEKLNRRWIGCNLDKVGIQVSRNRLVNQGAKPFLLENIGNYQRHMIYLSGSKINEMQRIILKLYGAAPRNDRPDLGSHTPDGEEPELVYVGYPDRPVTAKKVIELAQEAEILDGTGYKTLVVLAWDYDYNFNTELENRKAALRTPLKVDIKPLTIPPEIYNYLKKAKNEAELDSLRDKITFHEKPYLKVSKPEVSNAGDGKVVITLKIDRYVLMNYPIPEAQQVELRRAIKDNFAALIDYWAIDWDYDGKTFRSTWQAIRGNGKQASTVVTMATSPELSAGKRAIAVRLVDVFGNDASATVEVK
ncbi:site-specific DNA-methyltransferase [Nostoc sp. UHCC 0252]|uniref:site-specific DNA-methyltransferase n=1 Tax=Nostoc sp. UHCC 0252 TaxID=3110241 RepID=UPI002B21C7FF|nr:site-specific DNA-methyltransferase [Nostoc sp. UHCC 0252]MEA5604704.1 site-specific DNA-methyltransferase [Nostoc sp. UHCC 0252]